MKASTILTGLAVLAALLLAPPLAAPFIIAGAIWFWHEYDA